MKAVKPTKLQTAAEMPAKANGHDHGALESANPKKPSASADPIDDSTTSSNSNSNRPKAKQKRSKTHRTKSQRKAAGRSGDKAGTGNSSTGNNISLTPYLDLPLAEAFSDAYSGALKCKEEGSAQSWYRWAESRGVGRWIPTKPETQVSAYCRHEAKQIPKNASNRFKALQMLLSWSKVKAVSEAFRSSNAHSATVQWDSNPMLLGTPGGVVDLAAGKVRDAKPEDYILKSTAVAPAAPGTKPKRFLEFLDEITAGNRKLQDYWWRLFGYYLTGMTDEESLDFWEAVGKNGKSTLIKLLKYILKMYAYTIPIQALLASKFERHSTDIAQLRGVRLAVTTETPEGRIWDETLIKQLTSGDDINARKMRQDGVEFTPQCKLLIAGNNRPQLSTTNVAMRRRFRVTDFPVVIPEEKRDKKLKAALEEAQGGSTGNFAMDDRRLSGMAEERA